MACPAIVCFSMLKRDKRHVFRHSLSELQKAFLEMELSRRVPASYLRFTWFMASLSVALFALIAGQGTQLAPFLAAASLTVGLS